MIQYYEYIMNYMSLVCLEKKLLPGICLTLASNPSMVFHAWCKNYVLLSRRPGKVVSNRLSCWCREVVDMEETIETWCSYCNIMAHATPLKDFRCPTSFQRFQQRILPTQWDCWVQGELFPPLSAVHAGQGLIYTAVFEISGPRRCICFILIFRGVRRVPNFAKHWYLPLVPVSTALVSLQSGYINHH